MEVYRTGLVSVWGVVVCRHKDMEEVVGTF
jgi:hypothetical protein